MVFSREFGRFMPISEERLISFPPVGMLPSTADWDDRVDPGPLGYKKPYTVNEIDLLADGDILLLFTDGLSDHGGGHYFPGHLEQTLAASTEPDGRADLHTSAEGSAGPLPNPRTTSASWSSRRPRS